MQKNKHIHLIGICGTAMASLAGMLQQQGHRVTGSDAAAYPPMSDLLAGLGIPIHEPYAESNLNPRPDLVVVGNAISRGNPELEYVLDQRIPFCSMAAILHDEFLPGRESLVVAGTHGKTTTTSMLAWIYEVASQTNPELAPSFLIGGVAENFGTSFMVRPTRPFLLEGDEYDTAFFDKGPKFLHYFPDAAILTHVEFDHADIYADLDDVKLAFKRLSLLVPRTGLLLLGADSEHALALKAAAVSPVETYGFSESADWVAYELHAEDGRQRFCVRHGEGYVGTFDLPLLGRHNVRNALAAIAVGQTLGHDATTIARGLKSFTGVKRRLEIVGRAGGVTVYDDFAHHPTAVAETLHAVREAYPGRRVWAVFEPRSASSCRRRSSSLPCSTSIAAALFCSCERSFWQVTTMPVGKWVIRTAESVVFTP